jgi:glycosyltransferase involved in cell wall biosynthesis
MNIVHITTSDQGGAARACLRLHQGLLRQNINSSVLVQQLSSQQMIQGINKYNYSFIKKIRIKTGIILKEHNLYFKKSDYENLNRNKRSPNLEIFSNPGSLYDITENAYYKQAGLINLHWVANFLDFPSFFRKNKKPVIWTLHDMNPFTGGEHYSEWYSGIDSKGALIKRELSLVEKTVFKHNIEIKQKALKGVINLHLVSPSKWLAEEAKQSKIFQNTPISVIPNSIDTEIFQIRNQKYSRELFGLPNDKIILLFVADNIYNQRKGLKLLQEALKLILNKNVLLVAIGQTGNIKHSDIPMFNVTNVSDERLMSAIYSAADAFIIPSLMDNLPNTILESLSCGTPVLGFPVGGIKEMIKNGENGFLCDELSVSSLLTTINKFISDPNQFDRNKIGIDAHNKYSLHMQAEAYLKLYEHLLNRY